MQQLAFSSIKSFFRNYEKISNLFRHGLGLGVSHSLNAAIEIASGSFRLKQAYIKVGKHLSGVAQVIEVIVGVLGLTHDLIHTSRSHFPDTGDAFAIDAGTTFKFVARALGLLMAILHIRLFGEGETKIEGQ
jgi:hypothetical protein